MPDQPSQFLQIGSTRLELPASHNLPEIMRQHPRYDFGYWNLIREILAENDLLGAASVDIGANIGDSIAHFRRFSQGLAWGIEPVSDYFGFLKVNTAGFDNVWLSQALVAPAALSKKVRLSSGGGTGGTSLDAGDPYEGKTISPEEILAGLDDDFIVKSDTDGFDGQIIQGMADAMIATGKTARIVTFEGPTQAQMKSGDFADYSRALTTLQTMGYRIQILTNLGIPVAYVGASVAAMDWQMRALHGSFVAGRPMCHYFDFICVAPGLSLQTFDFTEKTLAALAVDQVSDPAV